MSNIFIKQLFTILKLKATTGKVDVSASFAFYDSLLASKSKLAKAKRMFSCMRCATNQQLTRGSPIKENPTSSNQNGIVRNLSTS